MGSDPNSLMPLVYDELRRIAAGYIRRERPGQTLQATALVNEAVRAPRRREGAAVQQPHPFPRHRRALDRQILVQRAAGAEGRQKRGGAPKASRSTKVSCPAKDRRSTSALDEALTRLEALDHRSRRGSSSCDYFGGMTVEETARSRRHLAGHRQRPVAMARAWLKRAIDCASDDGADGEP